MERTTSYRALLIAAGMLALSHTQAANVDQAVATLVVANETDATLTITVAPYVLRGASHSRIPRTIPPRQVVSFVGALPRGVVDIVAVPRCVTGVESTAKTLVVNQAPQYRLTFTSRDFGKSAMFDRPSCGSDEALIQGDCYAENKDIDLNGTGGRVLNGAMIANHQNLTVEDCVRHCGENNYPYAALQYGRWCFCGNVPGKKIDASACSMPCSGNSAQICGGAWANSVYSVRNFVGPRRDGADTTIQPPAPPKETCPEGYNAYGCGRR